MVDKPLHWTSFNVISKIKVLAKYKWNIPKLKIGHAGTLDPLATGLLLICTGRYTKEIERFQALKKRYSGTMTFGATTPSFDLETGIDCTYAYEHIGPDLLDSHRKKFIGPQDQYPPIFSAIKKNGKRAYESARAGRQLELTSRMVHIYAFDIQTQDFPDIHFDVVCSKGTYIRSLVHDFAKSLNSGAYLKSLTRTQIGDFNINNAWKLEDLEIYFINNQSE